MKEVSSIYLLSHLKCTKTLINSTDQPPMDKYNKYGDESVTNFRRYLLENGSCQRNIYNINIGWHEFALTIVLKI